MTMEYRSIWTSDHHLGNPLSQDKAFLNFIRNNDANIFGLVGDFIDGWSLKRKRYWPQIHNDVVQKLLRKSRKGAQVLLIPGNHDEFLEFLLNLVLGHITVVHEYIYTAADGKKYLVIHGHQFDVHVPLWLMKVASWAYDTSIFLNDIVHKARNLFRLPHWSLSNYLKSKTKRAVAYIENFEVMAVGYARTKGCDGVICGHIHEPCIKNIDGMIYLNCGDWVENCTALVEDFSGKFELIRVPRG